MNRIDQLFSRKQQDILNIYFTAGYPALAHTEQIILSLDKAGVDLVEVGMPYSDPLADGPTIQESGQIALQNGMTLPVLFQQLTAIRQKTEIPLVLMGYFNQVMQYGEDKFIEDCVACGIDGLILPDLPLYEYEKDYQAKFEAAGLNVCFLITPQTSEDRIKKVDDLSRGFVYMVSNASITGAKNDISEQQIAYFERISSMELKNPRLIGFGISNHDTYSTACKYANGAIIGSAFIRNLKAGDGDIEKKIATFIRSIREPAIV